MNLSWGVFEFFVCVIETIFFHIFFIRFLGKKDWCKWYHFAIVILINSTIIFIASIFSYISLWKILLGFMLLVLYATIFFKNKFWIKLIYATAIFALFGFTEVFAINIMAYFLGESYREVALTFNLNRICCLAISRVLVLLVYGVASNLKLTFNTEGYYIPNKYWISFLSIFSASFITMFLLLDACYYLNTDKFMTMISISISIILFLVFVCTYYLFTQICQYYEQKNMMGMIELQKESMEKYIIQQEFAINEVRDLSHNMKYQLSLIKELLMNGDIEEALASIDKQYKDIKKTKLLQLGSPIGTAIINQKMLEGRQNSVKFTVNGAFEEGLKVEQRDLCFVLGNLLDNALEATIEIEESEKRYISVNIKRDNRLIYITIENSYQNEPNELNEVLITSKENRPGHGIGLRSVKGIAKKYDGFAKYTYENHQFKMFVMMTAYDSKS